MGLLWWRMGFFGRCFLVFLNGRLYVGQPGGSGKPIYLSVDRTFTAEVISYEAMRRPNALLAWSLVLKLLCPSCAAAGTAGGTCVPSILTLESQLDVENTAFRCSSIIALVVRGSVTDLTPLSASLSQVTGSTAAGFSVVIEDTTDLKNLNGLELLGSTTGGLAVRRNKKLENIDGLKGLGFAHTLPSLADGAGAAGRSAGGAGITIEENDALLNIDGLESTEGDIMGAVTIRRNLMLKNINGLTGIRSILPPVPLPADYYALTIEGNDQLKDLHGLTALEHDKAGGIQIEGVQRKAHGAWVPAYVVCMCVSVLMYLA
jgi:hypothetical protein